MYSILQPKSEVEIVNERFMHESPLSAMLRTKLMFLTNGIFIWVAVSVAATIAATALTITKNISKVSSFVSAVFISHSNSAPQRGMFPRGWRR